MKQVTIYTDGACSGNPGPGGWGAILKYKEIERELSGGEAEGLGGGVGGIDGATANTSSTPSKRAGRARGGRAAGSNRTKSPR